MCVFITAGPITKLLGVGETMEDMCYERLRAEACVDITQGCSRACVFITTEPVCVYYCSTYYKAVRVGGEDMLMCYERLRAEAS